MAKTITKLFRRVTRHAGMAFGVSQRDRIEHLHRALAIQQNVFLHLFSTKVRTRMLSFSATWYLGTLTLGHF